MSDTRSHGLWWFVVAIAAVAGALLPVAGMQMDLASTLLSVAVLNALAALGTWYRFGELAPVFRRVAMALAQVVALCMALAVMTYALARLGADQPLLDPLLKRADRALGFDWNRVVLGLYAIPFAKPLLVLAYESIGPQMFAAVVLLAIRREGRDLSEYVVGYGLAALVCILTMAVVGGAVGNYPDATYARELVAVRAGERLVLNVRELKGIVSFPSFHAAAAVVTAWAFRRERVLRVPAVLLNLLMLVSTITGGAHYLVDVLAGVGVAAGAIVAAPQVVRVLDRVAAEPVGARETVHEAP